MNIYVGNLPYSVTEADLSETFSRFGEVSKVNLITDKFSGDSKGFGFVEMDNNSQADAAIKGLNDTDLKGRAIKVNQAKPYIIQAKPPTEVGKEYSIRPQQLEHYVNATRCINCFCCVAACISSHKSFLGPNALLASIVRIMDPREDEKAGRLWLLYGDRGVKRCHTSQACSFVCPKEIDVSHFIALAKEGRFKSSY